MAIRLGAGEAAGRPGAGDSSTGTAAPATGTAAPVPAADTSDAASPAGAGPDAEGPLAAARASADLIDAEAASAESAGTLTPPVVAALRRAGLFWMVVPQVLGGLEVDAVTFLDVIEEVSRADGSAGWSLMANSLSTGFAASYLSDDAVARVFDGAAGSGDGEGPLAAGMLGPAGTARPTDGGYVVSGRYQFASGSGHAGWILSGAVVGDGPDAGRQLVYCVPLDSVRMLGGWDVLGLEGTGSYDYEVGERFVEQGWTFDYFAPVARRGGALYRLGVQVLGSAGHAGVAVGIARRALEEIADISAGKVRGDLPPLAEQPVFQREFAIHEAAFQAARCLIWDLFGRAQQMVRDGAELSELDVQRIRQGLTYGTEVTADVVSFCYRWSGSAGLRNPSSLGRCFRDIHACTQHKYVDQSTLVTAGRLQLADWRRSRRVGGTGSDR